MQDSVTTWDLRSMPPEFTSRTIFLLLFSDAPGWLLIASALSDSLALCEAPRTS